MRLKSVSERCGLKTETLSMHYSYWNKILWLLTSALLGEDLAFKCRSMRKQLLIPKSQHPPLFLSLLEKYPPSTLWKDKKIGKTGTKRNL